MKEVKLVEDDQNSIMKCWIYYNDDRIEEKKFIRYNLLLFLNNFRCNNRYDINLVRVIKR